MAPYTTSVFSGLTSSGAHVPISIDSHPTPGDVNKFIVCEVPSSATLSSAPTTDDKQLPSVTMSKINPDKPLVPIAKVGREATLHRVDSTPSTSAGEMECLPQCRSVCTYFIPSLILYVLPFADVRGMSVRGRRLTQLFLHIRYI